MGWIKDTLKKAFSKKSTVYADTLNGTVPVFTQFGQNIYASDVVQQAVTCIVTEMSKLQPTHIQKNGDDLIPVIGQDSLQGILNNPNPLMTKTDFLEKVTWQLMLNYNAFIVPVFKQWKENKKTKRKYMALYPIQPIQVDFIEDARGTLFVKFLFANNFETTLPYADVIHIRKNFAVSEYMGGNESGQPDNAALLQTLQLNSDLLKGISAAMKASFAINGIVKVNTIIDEEATKKELKKFEKKLEKSKSGILPLDLKSDFIKIQRDVKLVDSETLKFIDEKILRFFGISLPILTGDYTKEQYEAFYQKAIEPLVNKYTEAFTKTLFLPEEKEFGNEVIFFPKDLIFMSVDQTLEMVRLLGDSGSLFENEKRKFFGLRPLKELEGVRVQSLNYANVNIAGQYQMKKGGEKVS